MANNNFGFAAGNFLESFTKAKQFKQQREEEKKEKAARLKLFEIQMDREKRAMQQQDEVLGARQQVEERMAGRAPTAAPGTFLEDPRGPASLTDLLADPEGAMLLLRSGMLKGEDILGAQGNAANRAMMERLIGGAGGPAGMEMTGLKVGPNGQMMPDFGLPQVTSPQTVMTPDGPRLKTFNPRTGAQVAELGEPKPDTVAPETAGRISGLVQAQEIASQISGQFINPDGKVDRALVLTSFANAPRSKGRQIRNDIGIAVDAVLRARTGAGVNVTEQKQVVEQFLPSPLDDDATIKSKLERLDQFVNGTLDIATLPASLRKRLEASDKGKTDSKVIDFGSLPD